MCETCLSQRLGRRYRPLNPTRMTSKIGKICPAVIRCLNYRKPFKTVFLCCLACQYVSIARAQVTYRAVHVTTYARHLLVVARHSFAQYREAAVITNVRKDDITTAQEVPLVQLLGQYPQ